MNIVCWFVFGEKKHPFMERKTWPFWNKWNYFCNNSTENWFSSCSVFLLNRAKFIIYLLFFVIVCKLIATINSILIEELYLVRMALYFRAILIYFANKMAQAVETSCHCRAANRIRNRKSRRKSIFEIIINFLRQFLLIILCSIIFRFSSSILLELFLNCAKKNNCHCSSIWNKSNESKKKRKEIVIVIP